MGSTDQRDASNAIHADVLVIGAGFTGIVAIHRLRKQGFNVKCFEQGEGFGGVWYWNRYFEHADKVLDLSKDTYFNARVIEATRDDDKNLWTIKTQQGHVATAKYLILGTGLLQRSYVPDFPGLEKYKGDLCHSAAWLKDLNAKGKRIGLIVAGATAVQITEQLGKVAEELVVFLRRPSYCLPTGQRKIFATEHDQLRPYIPALMKASRESVSGFPTIPLSRSMLANPREVWEAELERLWSLGGFHANQATYRDICFSPEANEFHYQFWRKKVCQRLTDPEKQKIMAPEKKPYHIGTKRCPLEQDYYEVLNQPNVKLHNLKTAPLKEFTKKGIITSDGKEYDFDAVVLATGFDALTGSLTKLGLKNKDGIDLKDLWANGVSTYLGLAISGFPNAFMAYSPQAPNTLSNGTTILQCQIDIIVDMINKLEGEEIKSIEPTPEAEREWQAATSEFADRTLFPQTDSWLNGANIPGKKTEFSTFLPGIAVYERNCRDTFENWRGWKVVRNK
ncbi:hypothetical protein CBER1_10325 [Cercospora berteroae]|uniref:FAD/NAD(P)-binding domain-containing protein n=1 Tax=Cercospora berteroae TaxID=357750 RepID=A0A2S6CHN4_9PEZI|nr:hypothetical protein CBER1_10325 [Cercospora berteroae]